MSRGVGVGYVAGTWGWDMWGRYCNDTRGALLCGPCQHRSYIIQFLAHHWTQSA